MAVLTAGEATIRTGAGIVYDQILNQKPGKHDISAVGIRSHPRRGGGIGMILIIDNYDSFTYNLYQSVAQFYPKIKVICATIESPLPKIKSLQPSGIILSPGPGRPETAGI